MPRIYLSPSTQEYNPYITGLGSEEYYMNLIADAMEPYLRANAIRWTRNSPDMTAASSIAQAAQSTYDFDQMLSNAREAYGEELLRMAEEDAAALQLTDHQKAILASVVRGLTNADIAKQMSVSEPTIKKTLWTIFERIGAANRAEAATIAIRKNLVKD